jgi:hypothetical protein
MTSFICDNCGVRTNAPNGMVPAGWFIFNITAVPPPPVNLAPAGANGDPPLTPVLGATPETLVLHADKQECADAITHRTTTPIT